MNSERTIMFRGSLITKLIVVCAIILLLIGVIVTTNLSSFRDIRHDLVTLIDRDVTQVIGNARLDREINQVFAETNLLLNTFIDRPEYLRSEGERLLIVLERNTIPSAKSGAEGIQNALEQFSRRLQTLLIRCAAANDVSQSIELLHDDISRELAGLEETVAAKILAGAMEEHGEESFALEHVSAAIHDYRGTLSQLTVLLMRAKHEYLMEKEVTAVKEQGLALLKKFDADLDFLSRTGQDFAAFEEQLREAVLQYQKEIESFYGEMVVFRELVAQLNSAREHLLIESELTDTLLTQSMSNIKEDAIDAIRISQNVVIYLSMFILVILLGLAYYIIRALKPIKDLARTASLLAEGNIAAQYLPPESNDEIGSLSQAFKKLIRYLQGMAMSATEIAQGSFSKDIQPKSIHDVLGNAFLEMASYLNDMAHVAEAVAEGDLTERVQLRSSDDAFGKMIVTMTEGLQVLIHQIRDSAEEIASTGTAIKSFSTGDIELAKHVDDLMNQAVSAMTDVGDSVNNVALNMETLSSAVEETSASVSQTALSIATIALSAINLNDRTRQMGTTLEETTSSVQKVVEHTDLSQQLAQKTIRDALEGQEAVEQVVNSMQTIQTTVATAVDAMNRFELRSHEIDTVLEVIREITEQTSLLALNASIIAAQAGSHGRGFAVVADEIRNLAQGVGASTKNIASIVTTLQQETSELVHTIHTGAEDVEQGMKRSRQAQNTLEKILSSTRHSSSVVTEMTEVLHDLGDSSRKLSQEMGQVSVMTDEIRQSISEHQSATAQIREAIEHISDKASEIQLATDQQSFGLRQVVDESHEVAQLIGQNLQSSQRISKTTEVLSSQAEILLTTVDRFKLKE